MKKHLPIIVLAIICIVIISPAMAKDNPYKNAHKVTGADVPVNAEDDIVKLSDTSGVAFDGAGYTHTIGRVSIGMKPLLKGLEGNPVNKGNRRISGTGHTIQYELYRDLIKEQVILKSPDTVSYSYDIGLSDWMTTEPDLSRPEVTMDANKTEIVSYPYIKQVTSYAKDSTSDIVLDPWGNIVVTVNGADVLVIPKPFAIDATGRRFELDFALDKNNKIITITGNLAGAQYPVTVDPTERVTNGGFESGSADGWTSDSTPPPTLTIVSGGANEGTYYCLDHGNGVWVGIAGYNRIYQTIDYTGVTSASMAVKIFNNNIYDYVLSDGFWTGPRNWAIGFPGQQPTGWVTKSATPTLTGSHFIQVWTYGGTTAGIDSIRVLPDLVPPVASFTATPTTGYRPLTVQFTDTSTGSPTSWSWNFGDGGTSTDRNPQHTYTNAGTYTVRLTVTNAAGSDTMEKPGLITVENPPYMESIQILPSSLPSMMYDKFTIEVKVKNPSSQPVYNAAIECTERGRLTDYHDDYVYQPADNPQRQDIPANGYAYYNFEYGHEWRWLYPHEQLSQQLGPIGAFLDEVGEIVGPLSQAMKTGFKLIDAYQIAELVKAKPSVTYNYHLSSDSVVNLQDTSKTVVINPLKAGYLLLSYTTGYSSAYFTAEAVEATVETVGLSDVAAVIVETAGMYITDQYMQMAYDPDQDYQEPVILEPITMPEINEVPQSPLKEWAESYIPLMSDVTALRKTTVKYFGAKKANDTEWETNQLIAMNYYLSLVENDYQTIGEKTEVADLYLKSNGFRLTQENVTVAKQIIYQDGLPKLEVNALRQLGYNDNDINATKYLVLTIPDEDLVDFQDLKAQTVKNQQFLVNEMIDITQADLYNRSVVNATIGIDPDTINLKSNGKWITGYIALPGHNVRQINISTVTVNGIIPAVNDPKYGFVKNPEIDDRDHDGYPELMVKFNRDDIQKVLRPGICPLIISGKINNIWFFGKGATRVV